MTEFEEIRTQEEFDARLGKRLAAERDKWERESGVEEVRTSMQAELDQLNAALEDKDRELADTHKQHRLGELERYTKNLLAERGVDDEGRQKRVFKLLDLEGADTTDKYTTPEKAVEWQLAQIANDIPELLAPKQFSIGSGSGIGSRKPVLTHEPALTEEQLAKMSPDEMAQEGVMRRIDKFMRGER